MADHKTILVIEDDPAIGAFVVRGLREAGYTVDHASNGDEGFDLARREKMTLRDLYNVTAAARGHWVIYGTPKRIADTLEEWFVSGLADGFVVMPAYFPGAFDDFVDRVVPELQRRGLYRTEYAGTTLRSHLGLDRPGIIRQQAAS